MCQRSHARLNEARLSAIAIAIAQCEGKESTHRRVVIESLPSLGFANTDTQGPEPPGVYGSWGGGGGYEATSVLSFGFPASASPPGRPSHPFNRSAPPHAPGEAEVLPRPRRRRRRTACTRFAGDLLSRCRPLICPECRPRRPPTRCRCGVDRRVGRGVCRWMEVRVERREREDDESACDTTHDTHRHTKRRDAQRHSLSTQRTHMHTLTQSA